MDEAPKLKTSDPQIIELWVRAGGRCEFSGCNEFLLQDKLTTHQAKFADVAHIVARTKDGPRGNDPLPVSERNSIDNLFLACLTHHRLIDNKRLAHKFPKELLIQYKRTHEERIRSVTGLDSKQETTIIRLFGNIRGNTVSISTDEIREAVLSSKHYPRYLGTGNPIEMDITGYSEKNLKDYWENGVEKIQDVNDRFIVPGVQKNEISHLSFFGFARIPFLAYFGYAVGDKIPIEIYQKHRTGTEGWQWPTAGDKINFKVTVNRNGKKQKNVAILFSLSGYITTEQLPKGLNTNYTIYTISPDGHVPNRNIMSTKQTLEQFRVTYEQLLRNIEHKHPTCSEVHIFPAMPLSAAVIVGRALLRNVSPALVIYDKANKFFEKAITLNSNNTQI